MVSHPPLDIGNQPILGGEAEEMAPRYAIRDVWADVRVEPAGHELPAQFVRDLEVLDDTGADGDPLDVAQLPHTLIIPARGENICQRIERLSEAVELERRPLTRRSAFA